LHCGYCGWWFCNSFQKNFFSILFKLCTLSPSTFHKFNFGQKLYFPYILIPNLREERESGRVLVIKKESLDEHRFRSQKDQFWYHEFHSMRGVWSKYSLLINFLKLVDLSRRIYEFVFLVWWILRLFKGIYNFIKIFRMFIDILG
jgi:hypothetical protein